MVFISAKDFGHSNASYSSFCQDYKTSVRILAAAKEISSNDVPPNIDNVLKLFEDTRDKAERNLRNAIPEKQMP